jgi:hypothetical protein
MTNPVLGLSSIFFGICHIFSFIVNGHTTYNWLYGVYILGIATSIGNHFTTTDIWKYGDRSIMLIGSAVDVYAIYNYIVWKRYACIGIFFGGIFYFIGKKKNNIKWHILCHGTVTITHLFMVYNLARNLSEKRTGFCSEKLE